jgi:hypothetical protein
VREAHGSRRQAGHPEEPRRHVVPGIRPELFPQLRRRREPAAAVAPEPEAAGQVAGSPSDASGFLTRYSTSAVEEDKAELFAPLRTEHRAVMRRAKWDEVTAAKASELKRRLRDFCPEIDESFEAMGRRGGQRHEEQRDVFDRVVEWLHRRMTARSWVVAAAVTVAAAVMISVVLGAAVAGLVAVGWKLTNSFVRAR